MTYNYDILFKYIVIGDSCIFLTIIATGKSSLIHRFSNCTFK